MSVVPSSVALQINNNNQLRTRCCLLWQQAKSWNSCTTLSTSGIWLFGFRVLAHFRFSFFMIWIPCLITSTLFRGEILWKRNQDIWMSEMINLVTKRNKPQRLGLSRTDKNLILRGNWNVTGPAQSENIQLSHLYLNPWTLPNFSFKSCCIFYTLNIEKWVWNANPFVFCFVIYFLKSSYNSYIGDRGKNSKSTWFNAFDPYLEIHVLIDFPSCKLEIPIYFLF